MKHNPPPTRIRREHQRLRREAVQRGYVCPVCGVGLTEANIATSERADARAGHLGRPTAFCCERCLQMQNGEDGNVDHERDAVRIRLPLPRFDVFDAEAARLGLPTVRFLQRILKREAKRLSGGTFPPTME